ncbi:MAG TPA: C10 family peptidase [bacterium]
MRICAAMILIVAYAVVGLSVSDASPLTGASRDAASAVVQNWMHYCREMHWTLSNPMDDSAPVLQDIFYDGQLVGYVSAQGNGYVVVPAYKDLPPVTAYSTASHFYVNDEGGLVALVKKDLANKIRVAQSALDMTRSAPKMEPAREQVEKDHRLWQSYAATYDVFRRAADAETNAHPLDERLDTGPLCKTAWHQTAPFNNFCPMGSGGRCAVGCVATAMSQILAYWRSPAGGTGSHNYSWPGDSSCGEATPGAILGASFSDPYDWANAGNVVTINSPQAQQDAVAHISYETGVAVNMMYGHCGSGAYVPGPVMTAFQNYFGMAAGENVVMRSSCTATSWFAALRQELQAGRPLFYTIYSHALVCDGYRVSGGNQLHFNFGWAEGHTTWYTVDNLYSPESGLTPMAEQAIRGIMPATTPPQMASTIVKSPGGGETALRNSFSSLRWISAGIYFVP